MRRMYSKKQIEGMIKNRSLIVTIDNKTYLATITLPKTVNSENLQENIDTFVGACVNTSDWSGHWIYLVYAQGVWGAYLDGEIKNISSIRVK